MTQNNNNTFSKGIKMKRRKLTKKACLNTLYESIANFTRSSEAQRLEAEERLTAWANSMTAKQFIAECEVSFGYTYTDDKGFAG